jgi:hypothetical protein
LKKCASQSYLQRPPHFLRAKAEECLALSYQIDDPKKQLAILKLASWWMRLAEEYLGGNRNDAAA